MKEINYKEYTRLRDIVQKRAKRLVAHGLAQPVHFPTVKEIRSGWVSGAEALEAVKGYYSGGSTLRAVKQTGLIPELKSFRVQPEVEKLSDEARKARKKKQDRLYRQRRQIRKSADNLTQAKKYEGYLKALDTVSKAWKSKGFNIGIDLQSLTPKQAQAFAEYMDYRFSQGDFNQHYVIDEFIQDFSKLMNKGYNPNDITADFEKFLEDRNGLENRALEMNGLSSDVISEYWSEFVYSDDEDDEDYLF
ncbi:MAG: hypothetical protein J6S67_00860 [Methanobrevibacter sp.]|nr:hypothetical protein [Methanobrevibacter sp.]